jgi:hypothetical protein
MAVAAVFHPLLQFERGCARRIRMRRPELQCFETNPRRSNPHSASDVLNALRSIPRFPPWRFVQRLPAGIAGYARVLAVRQASNKP